jgi:hypothetical protein
MTQGTHRRSQRGRRFRFDAKTPPRYLPLGRPGRAHHWLSSYLVRTWDVPPLQRSEGRRRGLWLRSSLCPGISFIGR